ncbi:MAG TPA: hypothetical protein VHW69_13825 [Rhizomicrobium sp.]|nr:hypothetical protein [Rhizomicrobium sp.]
MKTLKLKGPSLTGLGGVIVAGFIGSTCFAAAAQAATPAVERLQQEWRTAIAKTPTPGSGCYTATYPLTLWRQVECVKAPDRPYLPASGGGHAQTVGDGHDYAAGTATLTSAAVGSFPKAKHLLSESDDGQNVYSIQLNSNFMSGDQACSTAFNPGNCLGWLQYVYSSSSHAAFMQYWLIHYSGGSVHCPGGWNSFSDDCYKNSSATGVPQEPITDLPKISLSGSAVHAGLDTLKFMDGTNAYSTTGQDSVMFLADGWNASEFNVIGDGGGSQANFNVGTALSVEIDVTDGTADAPTCQANAGTTGETNNLNLKKCTASGGATPKISFKEVLKK